MDFVLDAEMKCIRMLYHKFRAKEHSSLTLTPLFYFSSFG
jgi:hypothetical protein